MSQRGNSLSTLAGAGRLAHRASRCPPTAGLISLLACLTLRALAVWRSSDADDCPHRARLSQASREVVAIKVVQRAKMTSKLLENLEAEIMILKAIHHPNIVGLEDCLVRPRQTL